MGELKERIAAVLASHARGASTISGAAHCDCGASIGPSRPGVLADHQADLLLSLFATELKELS